MGIAKLLPITERNAATAIRIKMLISNAVRQKRRVNGEAPLPCRRLQPCNSNDPREVVRPENFNRMLSHLLVFKSTSVDATLRTIVE